MPIGWKNEVANLMKKIKQIRVRNPVLKLRRTREQLVNTNPVRRKELTFFPSASRPNTSWAISMMNNPPPVMIPTWV
jgi:hypothetical protein